jgi:PQQ system protein
VIPFSTTHEEVGSVATLTPDRSDQLRKFGLDKQNDATLGRLVATGNIAQAEEDQDGRMRAEIHIVPDQLIWDPSVLVLPHGGELEIEFVNDDQNTHCALVPSNGDSQWMWLPNYTRGTMRVSLDGPGQYWFTSNIGNDEGRGLIGAIVVKGDVPASARLDRPPQPRP